MVVLQYLSGLDSCMLRMPLTGDETVLKGVCYCVRSPLDLYASLLGIVVGVSWKYEVYL